MAAPHRLLRFNQVLPLILVICSCLLAALAVPSCRFRADAGWHTCARFSLSNCATHFTEPVTPTSVVFDDRGSTAPSSVNITFNTTLDGVNIFLVSGNLAQGCSPTCYNVVPDHVLLYQPIQVELAFLPADAVSKMAPEVARLDGREFNNWVTHTGTNESEVQDFLHASNITIDFEGPDAHLRLAPPSENAVAPKIMTSACVTFYSDVGAFSCSRCSCDLGGERVIKSFCLDSPFDVRFLQIKNATSFYNGTHRLMFHWVVLQIGGSCLTARWRLPLPPSSVPPTLHEPSSRGTILASVCTGLTALVVLGVCARCLIACLSRKAEAAASPPELDHQRKQLIIEGQSEVVLLYRRDELENPPFQRALQLLVEIVGHTDQVQVLDPYEWPMLPELGRVEAVQTILTKPNIFILFFATERAFQVERDDLWDQFFVAALRHVEENQGIIGPGQILTIITNDGPTLFAPWDRRVYFLPDKIENLLHDIPGASASGDRFLEIEALLVNLRVQLRKLNFRRDVK